MNLGMTLAIATLLGMLQEAENPQFQYWTNCKVGSWVKMRMDFEGGGQKIQTESTTKLLEIKDGSVTVEITGKSKMAAGEFPIPAQKQEIKAKESDYKVKIEKEGDEEIEVAGKKLKCRWYETSSKAGEKTTKGKAWMSKDVPGGMAKAVMTPEGGPTMTIVALEWEKK